MAGHVLGAMKYSWRRARRQPGLTAVILATLALGVGVNVAVYAAVHGLLVRPLPYPEPERLAIVALTWPEGRFWLSEGDVLALREQSTLFEGLAVVDEDGATLAGGRTPERVNVGAVSANLFSVLGVSAAVGRTFRPEDDRPGGPRLAVISDALWQRRFGGAMDVVGQSLELDGQPPFEIIGVMPRSFQVLLSVNAAHHKGVDVWRPHSVDYRTANRGRNLIVLGRLKRGVGWPAAQDELARIARTVFVEPASRNTFTAFPLQADAVGHVRQPLLVLMAASGVVLLLACANVANLLLLRSAGQRHEVGVRVALGATGGHLGTEILVESVSLAVLGGAIGLGAAGFAVRFLSAWLSAGLPQVEQVGITPAVLELAAGVSILAGVLCGVLATRRVMRGGIDAVVASARPAGGPRWSSRAIVVGQVALSLMLAAGGALFARSFWNLRHADLGFNPAQTLTFSVDLPATRYRDVEAIEDFIARAEDGLRAVPGVTAVGGGFLLPFGSSLFQTAFTFYQSPLAATQGSDPVEAVLARPTLPGYFDALEVRLVAGRVFTAADTSTSERVAIVDETLAGRMWPDASPIGRRVARGANPAAPSFYTVVGVIQNLRLSSLTGERLGEVFVPIGQLTPRQFSFVLRTEVPPSSVVPAVRTAMAGVDAGVALYEVGELDQVVADVMAPERLTSWLTGIFAVLGLLLATLGAFGVMSHAVRQRTRDIGIRIALGASRARIYADVALEAMGMTAVGVVVGLGGTLLVAPAARGLLIGVSPYDVPTHAGVTAVLLLTVTVVCLRPAARATQVDPLEALRHD